MGILLKFLHKKLLSEYAQKLIEGLEVADVVSLGFYSNSIEMLIGESRLYLSSHSFSSLDWIFLLSAARRRQAALTAMRVAEVAEIYMREIDAAVLRRAGK